MTGSSLDGVMIVNAVTAKGGQAELVSALDRVVGEDEQNLAEALDPGKSINGLKS